MAGINILLLVFLLLVLLPLVKYSQWTYLLFYFNCNITVFNSVEKTISLFYHVPIIYLDI